MGGISFSKKWALAPAWEAAVDLTAGLYQVEAALLRAPSRGRGPRPPKRVWDAKKVAVYLTVTLSDTSAAEIGRMLGFHRDTIASQCADVRKAMGEDDTFEAAVHALEQFARTRLAQAAQARLEAFRRDAAGAYDSSSDHNSPAHPTPTKAPGSQIRELGTKGRAA